MIGIITEKPSAARNFSTALGGMKGTYNGEEYVIVSAVGHLYQYCSPEKQVSDELAPKYKSWDIENLPWNEKDFMWIKEKKDGAPAILKQMKGILKACDEIVIATDDDPSGEGEMIGWEILDGLNLLNKNISRMYFEDETKKEIQNAFRSRKRLTVMERDMDYIKAQYRSQWDMLSMQFTRVATACVGSRAVLRQGRLKSVMVKMVGDALKALKEYKPKPYFLNKFKDENGVIYTNKDEPRYDKKEDVPAKYHASDVIRDSMTMKRTAPPKLVDLAMLSSMLSSKGFKAKTVLDVYQKMYDDQVVSYPRTEDKAITQEQFYDLLPKVDAIAAVVGIDTSLLTHRVPRSTHVKSGGAHGANRPGSNVPSSLDELKRYGACAPYIYEILARNYLAMLAEDYEYESQKGHIKDDPAFVGTASVPKKMGWKLIYNEGVDKTEDENAKGLGFKADPFVAEGVNPKPPTPTMSWLTRQLEKNDVGTGSTRTSIYADVTNENAKYPLLIDTKGKLTMTQYGQMSYALLKDTFIGDVKATEALVQEIRDIASGKAEPDVCLQKVQRYVIHDMKVMKKNAAQTSLMLGNGSDNMSNAISTGLICPVCGSPMNRFDWGYGCSGYQEGCKFSVGAICEKKLT